jgi:hypothetical protein
MTSLMRHLRSTMAPRPFSGNPASPRQQRPRRRP